MNDKIDIVRIEFGVSSLDEMFEHRLVGVSIAMCTHAWNIYIRMYG